MILWISKDFMNFKDSLKKNDHNKLSFTKSHCRLLFIFFRERERERERERGEERGGKRERREERGRKEERVCERRDEREGREIVKS